MAHLIDKDALVAEIDRQKIGYNVDGKHSVEYDTTRKILNIIDTFEVKEVKKVDLDREMQAFASLYLEPLKISDSNIGISITMAQLYSCAKHFFELGLRTSNPLTLEDIEMIGKLRLKVALDLRNKELESSINNPIKFTEEDFCKEVLKRFKAQKGEEV